MKIKNYIGGIILMIVCIAVFSDILTALFGIWGYYLCLIVSTVIGVGLLLADDENEDDKK